MRQYTEALGIISGLHARAVCTWKFGALVLALYLTVTCSMSGCCRAEYSALDSSGDDFTGCATFGSTVDTCYASVHWAFRRISTISTSIWTRNLRCFVSVLTQNGEVCSVGASGCCPCMRCSHTNPEFLRAARGWQFVCWRRTCQ